MSLNRIKFCLAAIFLLGSGGLTAFGQDHELEGMQLFEGADVRPYGNPSQPRNGFFFSFDGLYWHTSTPRIASIGDPTAVVFSFKSPPNLVPPQQVAYDPNNTAPYYVWRANFLAIVAAQSNPSQYLTQEVNSLDTGDDSSIWKLGNRLEFGYIEDHHGFMVTTLNMNSQTTDFTRAGVDVVFNDPPQGPNAVHLLDAQIAGSTQSLIANPNFPNGTTPPDLVITSGTPLFGRPAVLFNTAFVQYKSRLTGVEALYMYRPSELHDGGSLEFTLGARYLELKDQYWVDARGGILADSFWNTKSRNSIAGPEIGARWFMPLGRFALSAESRFTAGINSESINQDGILGSQLTPAARGANGVTNQSFAPLAYNGSAFNNAAHFTEFSPIIELRLEGHVQVTNMIAAKVGWTGMWINNVARAVDMVDYSLPTMGITTANDANKQSVFVNGLTFGVELQR